MKTSLFLHAANRHQRDKRLQLYNTHDTTEYRNEEGREVPDLGSCFEVFTYLPYWTASESHTDAESESFSLALSCVCAVLQLWWSSVHSRVAERECCNINTLFCSFRFLNFFLSHSQLSTYHILPRVCVIWAQSSALAH